MLLTLLDVNDHGPEPDRRKLTVCNHNPAPQLLRILDKDLPPHTSPFRAELSHHSEENWAVEMDSKGGLLRVRGTWLRSSPPRPGWLEKWAST